MPPVPLTTLYALRGAHTVVLVSSSGLSADVLPADSVGEAQSLAILHPEAHTLGTEGCSPCHSPTQQTWVWASLAARSGGRAERRALQRGVWPG